MNATLLGTPFSGDNGYVGFWVGDGNEPFGDDSLNLSPRRALFQMLKKDDSPPDTINVPSGSPFLHGVLTDADGVSAPAGISITITDPNGNVLDQATPITASGNVIQADSEGNIIGFLIPNPTQGTWTIVVEGANSDEPSFQLFATTLPTSDAQSTIDQTIQETFKQLFDKKDLQHYFGPEFSWGCIACTIGVWSLAVIIIVAVIIGAALLTEGSAVVIALVAWVNTAAVTSAVALAFIRGLVAVVALGISAVVNNLCGWTGACSDEGLRVLNSRSQSGAVGDANAPVTVTFNNPQKFGGVVKIYGYDGNGGSGMVYSNTLASGLSLTAVVSGWASYSASFANGRSGDNIYSPVATEDETFSLIFAAYE